MSKWSAKRMVGAQVIETPADPTERWLVDTVGRQAQAAGIGMPEVAIYEAEDVNAFATGWNRNDSLVAVSRGLLDSMSRDEAEAVLAHEVAHVANGDMVTLTLIQGVVNTFVVFLARIVGSIVDKAIFRTERGTGPGYFITVMVCQIVFSVLASIIVAYFSRRREFRADSGAASFLGNPQPMINALKRLGGVEPGALPKTMAGFGITDRAGIMALFSTHPPMEDRIRALQTGAAG
jgi:heat shock protein HtpX